MAAEKGTEAREPRGTSQTANRALVLLKLVAAAPGDGLRLADIASEAGFDRATAHRLLASLMQHAFIEQDPDSKRYRLGLEFFTLAAAASNRFDVTEVARAALRRLSERTGDTSFFCLRSGSDLVCIDVETGTHPIKTLPLDVGSKRPIGLGSVGLAALATLPESESELTLQRSGEKLAHHSGMSLKAYKAELARARSAGYAILPEDDHQLMLGVAVALINRRGRPQGTLSVTGLAELSTPARLAEIAKHLTAEARSVEDSMWRLPEERRHRRRWKGE